MTTPTVPMEDQKEVMFGYRRKLAQLLLAKSYEEGDFTLASGRKSDYYFDCRVTSLSAKGAFLIGELFNYNIQQLAERDQDPSPIVGVAGMTMGADPLVTATSIASLNYKRHLDGMLVRKAPKDHGMGRTVEGTKNFKPGDQIVMLEDVITTGGSLIKATNFVREAGFTVKYALVILDREEWTEGVFEKADLQVLPIFNRKTLKALAEI